jgi:5'-3' exonuclease
MFQLAEVIHHFGLSREKLVLLAMLTGSDYTDGVEGVGPVTALEILAEFPGDGLEPLVQLKAWWNRVHQVTMFVECKCVFKRSMLLCVHQGQKDPGSASKKFKYF